MSKVKNKYIWSTDVRNAPLIEPHSKIKHSIIKDYLRSYLKVVANPLCRKIKLVIVDGFCGGGLYRTNDGCAHFGSPIITIDVIRETIAEIIAERAAENIKHELRVECELFFVDSDPTAIETLKEISAPHLITKDGVPVKFSPHFINNEFLRVYKDILAKIGKSKAIFVLDPFSYNEAPLPVIRNIMNNNGEKREVIWTLMIQQMSSFAHENSVALMNAGYGGLLDLFQRSEKPSGFEIQMGIYNTIKKEISVPFFTPFALKQKRGWDYWLIHLAWHHRASEVMKEVEHRHADQRIHHGSPGLNMMAAQGDAPYLFGQGDVERGRAQLCFDIPRVLEMSQLESGITFDDFMKLTYNDTPLTSDVIKETLINHEDIDVSTSNNGNRSSHKRIKTDDIIRLKRQRIFDLKPRKV